MSCTRDLILAEAPGTPARFVYWTMEETGFSNRVDMVSSLAMPVTASTTGPSNAFVGNALGVEGAGGLFGNGFHIAKSLPNQYTLTGTYTTEASLGVGITSADLRHDGTGFSFCFWLKVDLPNTIVGLITYIRSSYFTAQLRFDSVNCVARLRYGAAPSEDVALPLPSVGVWTFYELFYDPVMVKMGCRINDTTDYLASFVPVMAASPSGSFTIIHNGFPGDFTTTHDATDCQNFTTDEVLICMSQRLSVAQRAYLYNSGSGRTWPIVLP